MPHKAALRCAQQPPQSPHPPKHPPQPPQLRAHLNSPALCLAKLLSGAPSDGCQSEGRRELARLLPRRMLRPACGRARVHARARCARMHARACLGVHSPTPRTPTTTTRNPTHPLHTPPPTPPYGLRNPNPTQPPLHAPLSPSSAPFSPSSLPLPCCLPASSLHQGCRRIWSSVILRAHGLKGLKFKV